MGGSKGAYLLYVESTLRSLWEQWDRRTGWGSGHRKLSPQAEARCSFPAMTLAWSLYLQARPFARECLPLPVPGVVGLSSLTQLDRAANSSSHLPGWAHDYLVKSGKSLEQKFALQVKGFCFVFLVQRGCVFKTTLLCNPIKSGT